MNIKHIGNVVLVFGLLLCAGCGNTYKDSSGTLVVEMTEFWGSFKDIPELNRLFEEASPGDTIEFKVKFPEDHNLDLQYKEANIEKGSITFFTKHGFIKMVGNRTFEVKPGKDLDQIEINDSFIIHDPKIKFLNLMGFKKKLGDWELAEEYAYLDLPRKKEDGVEIATVRCKLSEDFQGNIKWRLFQGH